MTFQNLIKLFVCACGAVQLAACDFGGEETDSTQTDETTQTAETNARPDRPTSSSPSDEGQTGSGTATDETKPSEGTTAEAPPSATGVDVFGVTMMYPSKPGGESWAMSDDPNNDPRFDPRNPLTRNSDGSFKMKAGQLRMLVFTSDGYEPSAIKTYDREVLAAQGYMQSERDWKNVEITGFVKANKIEDIKDSLTWYARGGRHNDTAPCEGSSYKADLHFDGRVRMAKESWHVSYDYTDYKNAVSPLQGRWVGFKTAIRNVEVDGKTAVKVESWVDDKADGKSFVKVFEFVDDGTWAGSSSQCGAKDTKAPVVWGGPIASFRWDAASDVDVKWLSVREVTP